MPQLCRAIYVSEAVGGAGSNLLSIAEILGVSARNNRRDRLTGVLLCHEGWFLQALEGARSDIERLLNKLQTDRRHKNLRMISFEPIEQRAFPDWSMNQVMITPKVGALVARRPLDALDGPDAFDLLNAAAAMNPGPQA